MLLASVALLLLSLFAPAPIAPAMTSAPAIAGSTRAPWFFLWVQQMLKWGSPFLWGVIVPLAVLLALTLIPYIFPKNRHRRAWKMVPPQRSSCPGIFHFDCFIHPCFDCPGPPPFLKLVLPARSARFSVLVTK